MIARAWIAPVGLFLLQAAPVGLVQDQDGRYQVEFGGSLGSYEERNLDCSGNVLARERMKFTSAGVAASARISPTLSLSAFGGRLDSRHGSGDSVAPPFSGNFGGALISGEGRTVGFGAGLFVSPLGYPDLSGATSAVRAAASLRLGRRDGFQVRMDVGSPASPGGPPERARLGLGHPMPEPGRPGWMLHLGASDFPVVGGPRATVGGQLRIAVNRRSQVGGIVTYRNPNGASFGIFAGLAFGNP